ncbi:MAG: nitroreductase/quinone reductase family protein [Acidimicrobiales bacterium]
MTNDDSTLNFNQKIIAEFRANGGRTEAFGDAPLLLLTTKGAKTGREHTSPVMYLADEHDSTLVYVFASYAGADSNPAWYYNVLANPYEVTVEIGVEAVSASAAVLDEPRRTAIYNEQAKRFPGFAEYQAKTTRTIPVVELKLHQ